MTRDLFCFPNKDTGIVVITCIHQSATKWPCAKPGIISVPERCANTQYRWVTQTQFPHNLQKLPNGFTCPNISNAPLFHLASCSLAEFDIRRKQYERVEPNVLLPVPAVFGSSRDVNAGFCFQFLYAFNIAPMKSLETAELTRQPQDVTECPYKLDSALLKSKQVQQAKSGEGSLSLSLIPHFLPFSLSLSLSLPLP